MSVQWSGDDTGQPCPKCGGRLVYNGNYFCETADYAMSGEDTMPKWEAKLLLRAYTGLMRRRGEEPSQLALQDMSRQAGHSV